MECTIANQMTHEIRVEKRSLGLVSQSNLNHCHCLPHGLDAILSHCAMTLSKGRWHHRLVKWWILPTTTSHLACLCTSIGFAPLKLICLLQLYHKPSSFLKILTTGDHASAVALFLLHRSEFDAVLCLMFQILLSPSIGAFELFALVCKSHKKRSSALTRLPSDKRMCTKCTAYIQKH